jgi:ABC-type branched-subunit amino acid transport system substrate-binding protein/class 3 adenylate cyclase
MEEPGSGAPTADAAGGSSVAAGSLTRGFLFADLREYTRYVEEHGAADAASLLLRYRTLVRGAVAAHDGAEIKTEGDSFYVVFPAASGAVLCGLDIVDAAGVGASDADERPIPVGIGIHAGETVVTPDGFVGQPVNIAARLCALAQSGEVLVSDTVRALTQTVLPVSFDPRGRRNLKGVTEPVAVYAVARSDAAWAPQKRRATRRRRLAVAGIAMALAGVAAAGAWVLTRPPPGLPPGPWTIGVDLPLSGDSANGGTLVRDAVQLAVDDVNAAGGIGGSQLVLDVGDDGQDPDVGATNVTAFIDDPRTVAMIGPWGSHVAIAEIPLTNAAGLLECSPSNTLPQLTKPREGALDLRAAHPDRISYIRTAPADDIQGPALASFVFVDLHAASTLVIDDGDAGRDIADHFADAYQRLGGFVVRRTLNLGVDPATVLEPLSGANAPAAVFFGGFTETGAPDVRSAMVAAGKQAVPFVSWDDGRVFDRWNSHAFDDTFLLLTGPDAAGSYFSHAAVALPKAGFVDRYRTRFADTPDEYSAAAYACAQIIFDALRAVAATGPSAPTLREAVRAYAVDTSHRYETVIGTVGFDANGDSLQQFVTFYRVDPSAAGGKGAWVIDKQQDYGPAP